jgi:formimidoylglutamate deiminase
VVVLDPDHPTLAGRVGDELLDSWIFSGDDNPVRDVLVGGRWVVRNGRHVLADEVAGEYRAVAYELSGASPQLHIDFE